MPYKTFTFEDIGEVTIYKNRKSKSLRLSMKNDGKVRLTIPFWVTYPIGVKFIIKNKEWILEQEKTQPILLTDQQKIGKIHRLIFLNGKNDSIRTSIKDNYISIALPEGIEHSSRQSQDAAIKAAKKALKQESLILLPARVSELADKHGFSFNNVSTRSLKGRWGSCDQNKDLTFNIFLMQLPWHLIDYVIIHELVHTKHMNHSQDFWDEFRVHLDNAKELRHEIKNYRPVISITD